MQAGPGTLHVHAPGRAATAVAVLALRAGFSLGSVSGGRSGVPDELQRRAPGLKPQPAPGPLHGGQMLLVGERDDRLPGALEGLARQGLPEELLVVHLSGARGLEVFPSGWPARRGAFHPLRAFPTRDPGPGDLEGCLVAVAADGEDAVRRLQDLARDLGGQPFHLPDAGRDLYHLGASVAGNGLLALLDLAEEAFRRAGVPEELALPGLRRLVEGVLARCGEQGPAEALTGPVVRGDLGVLDRHLEALQRLSPERVGLYRELVAALEALAGKRPEGGAPGVAAWLRGHGGSRG